MFVWCRKGYTAISYCIWIYEPLNSCDYLFTCVPCFIGDWGTKELNGLFLVPPPVRSGTRTCNRYLLTLKLFPARRGQRQHGYKIGVYERMRVVPWTFKKQFHFYRLDLFVCLFVFSQQQWPCFLTIRSLCLVMLLPKPTTDPMLDRAKTSGF